MKSLKHINKYFYKYRWRFLLGVLFVGISNYFAVDGIAYARKAVDFVEVNASHSDKEYLLTQLSFYAFKIIGLAVLSGLFLFFTRQTIIVMSRLIEFDLKNEIYNQYQVLDMAFYKRNNTGDMMNRISEDVGRVRMYIGPAIMYILNTLFRFILTITVMIHVNAELTVYVLMPLPLLAIAIYYVSQTINNKSTKIQEQLSNITTKAQEAFSGIRVLKAYGRESFSVTEFEVASKEYKKRTIGLIKVEALFQPIMILLIGLSNIFIIYIGGNLAIEGKVSYGNIAEFVLYVNALTWPIASLGWVTSLIQRAAASQTRINEFLTSKPDVYTPNNAKSVVGFEISEVEFRNVSFTYPDTQIQALNTVSFKIAKGETMAIIGRTGSGKSTIANLLCRLYDVDSGEILINGKNIASHNLSDLRSEMGYVPQEVFLFSDTIANNIAFSYGGSDVKEKGNKVAEAAKAAAIYSNIMEFPEGFETMVGERGVTLSGGQKQRISIARAIIRKPNLLLFDDCLSAVDTETEEQILGNLKNIMNERISIIISHRVSSVKHADTILVLDGGKIVEKGSHTYLMNLKGAYYELYQMQLLEDEKAI